MFNVSMYQMKTIPEILTILGLVYVYLKCYFEVNKVDDLDLWCTVLKFDTFVIIVNCNCKFSGKSEVLFIEIVKMS